MSVHVEHSIKMKNYLLKVKKTKKRGLEFYPQKCDVHNAQ